MNTNCFEAYKIMIEANRALKVAQFALETMIDTEEYELSCEEVAIDIIANSPSDIPAHVRKSLAYQERKWHTYELRRWENLEDKFEKGRRKHCWNRKSKKAQKELGLRRLRRLSY